MMSKYIGQKKQKDSEAAKYVYLMLRVIVQYSDNKIE
jgi:hypothetical protein